jgi:biotin carboxyl carrier protein
VAPAPEATPSDVGRFLEEIARLLEAAPAPNEFYAEFLQRVIAALGGVAGAVWLRTPEGQFQLQYQVNQAAVGLDAVPGGRACHAELLRKAAQRDRPSWAPPRSGPDPAGDQPTAANRTAFGLLLAPVRIDEQVAGLVEVWQDPRQEAASWRTFGRFLMEMAGFAGAYLHRIQLRQLRAQQEVAARVDAFTRQIHASLDPREVACLVANQGRRLLECDQLSVAVRRGRAVAVEAVSGAGFVEQRGRLSRALAALCERVLAWGEKLVYAGSRDGALPPKVAAALDAYLAESPCQLLVVLPLKAERDDGPDRPARAALVAECFEPSFARDHLEARLAALAPHAALALDNALDHHRLPLGWLTRPLARVRDWGHGRGWVRPAVVGAVLAGLIAGLTLVRIPLRLDARGQLVPQDRQIVYATVNGKVVEVKARHGDRVDRGQELLFLEDLETQLKVEQLGIKINSAQQRLAMLGERLGKAVTADERNTLTRERINQEYELRKAAAERDLLLQESRSPRKAPVPAPLSGKVITFDANEQLLGKTVKPGDPLLRVARVEGPWEIELQIPEGHIGPIQEALRRAPAGRLAVDLLLASQPNRTYQGWLDKGGLGGETTVKDNAVVLPARVRIGKDLAGQLGGMPVGVEVRAKVHCGDRSVAYVWFFDLAEFFYEHVLF